jgi:hypothetical protein
MKSTLIVAGTFALGFIGLVTAAPAMADTTGGVSCSPAVLCNILYTPIGLAQGVASTPAGFAGTVAQTPQALTAIANTPRDFLASVASTPAGFVGTVAQTPQALTAIANTPRDFLASVASTFGPVTLGGNAGSP